MKMKINGYEVEGEVEEIRLLIGFVTKNETITHRQKTMPQEQQKKWNKKEIKFLMDNKDLMTMKEIGEKLGRSISSVTGKYFAERDRMKLQGKEVKELVSQKPWTDREIMFIKRFSDKYSASEIGEKLGRSVNAVYVMQSKLRNNGEGDLVKTNREEKFEEIKKVMEERNISFKDAFLQLHNRIPGGSDYRKAREFGLIE